MESELTNYLVVGAVLFSLGAWLSTRRNLIVAILSAEMMLLAVTLNLVAFSYEHANFEGQVFTAIVLTVAACEAGLALALLSALYRLRKTLDISVCAIWANRISNCPRSRRSPAAPRDKRTLSAAHPGRPNPRNSLAGGADPCLARSRPLPSG